MPRRGLQPEAGIGLAGFDQRGQIGQPLNRAARQNRQPAARLA